MVGYTLTFVTLLDQWACHAWQVIIVTHSIHIWVRMFWCVALSSRAETSGTVPTWVFNAL